MALSLAYYILICVVIFFIFVIMMRKKIHAILAEGIKIYFDGDPREMCECIRYDINETSRKISLTINDPNVLGEFYETGFIFDEMDFSPPITLVNWENFFGILKCFKSKDGVNDGRTKDLKEAHAIIKKVQETGNIYTHMSNQQRKEFGLQHIVDERKKETFNNAGALDSIKKLASDPIPIEKQKETEISKFFNQ